MEENAVGRNAAISYPGQGQGIKSDENCFGQVVWLQWWRYNIVRKSGLKGKNCISELTKEEEEEESNFIQGGKGGGVGALDMVLPKQLFSL